MNMKLTFSYGPDYLKFFLIQNLYKLVLFSFVLQPLKVNIKLWFHIYSTSYVREIWRLVTTKFYKQHFAEPTYPTMQCAAVTTQFGLIMEPPQMCDPENYTDTWYSNTHYHWTEIAERLCLF